MRVRTGYSFRAAAGEINDVYAKLKEFNWGFYPMTDRASTFGFNNWKKLVEKNGDKPVFGVELLVSENPQAKKPVSDPWVFIAKGSLRPINEAVQLATEQFRFTPLMNYEQACAVDAYKIIGHKTPVHLLQERVDVSEVPDLYYGLSPALTTGQYKRYKALGIPPVAVSDNRYLNPEDQAFYEILVGRDSEVQTYPQWLMNDQEWADYIRKHIRGLDEADIELAIANRQKIGEESTATLVNGRLPAKDWETTIDQQCLEGAERLGVELDPEVYGPRLERELQLIHDKNFDDYFQIVGDLVRYSRGIMAVGPARGSSCGSLVCYLLGITTVDPIPHNLVFERFIDINRDDLPDIDIDFSDENRHLAFEYLAAKYGQDHMARLGTVSTYQPKMAINEAGAALKIPKWETDGAMDGLIERSSGDARALDTLEDTLRETPKGKKLLDENPEILIATKMQGHPRHSGQHAAGIILTDGEILDHIAIDMRKLSAQCDKHDAEDLDLLKIDALGLTQLSIFEDTMDLIGMEYEDLYKITFDDPKAFDVLNKGHYSGIFQFNGRALKTLTEQVTVTEFEDINAITALARPGPLVSGGAQDWVNRKNGSTPIEYPHPMFEPHMKDSLGIVIYQEQIMNIGREIGKLSWGDVTALRKAMSKSLGKEYFDQFGDKFKAGAVENGVPFDVASEVWENMNDYGSWCFNRSHSVAYGMISYYCCWFKAHYPIEFAAGTLSHEKDPDRQMQLLRELRDEGIDYTPVDKDHSTDKWAVAEKDGVKHLVGPLSAVNGIGPKMMNNILDARKNGDPMPKSAEKKLQAPKTKIDSLYPVQDRINQICPDLSEINVLTEPMKIGDITEDHEQDMMGVVLIGKAVKINPRNENETIKIAKRGYELKAGPLDSLNITLEDDTGQIFAHVSRFKFNQLGKEVVDRGRPGKSLYILKGKIIKQRRFMIVERVKYFGDMDPDFAEQSEIAAE